MIESLLLLLFRCREYQTALHHTDFDRYIDIKVSGGRFFAGFLSAGASSAFASSGMYDSGIGAVVAGGTTAVLGGGKFANGAATFGFLRLFGKIANYATRETDRLKQLACSSGDGPCNYDHRGVLRTDGGREVDWTHNPDQDGNWLTKAGMEREGEAHIYENNILVRNFIVDVSKIHEFA